jgi:DNA-binding response OmpR family regulator
MAELVKILLIDDDRDFVEATRIVLESGPYRVIPAYSGREGLQKVDEEEPHLIILDIIMPGEDGFEVCRELKRHPRHADIPIIMLTSLSRRLGQTHYSLADGMMLEAEDYVDKPVHPQELLRRVRKLLEM